MAYPWENKALMNYGRPGYSGLGSPNYVPKYQNVGGQNVPISSLPAAYQPPIPAGYYDPSLDAQRDAASRGLLNTEQDVGLGGRRAQEDLGYATGQIQTGYQRGMEDLGTGNARNQQDVQTQRDTAHQDYDTNVAMLTRQYGQQGRQQAEQARKYGVTSGGIALLSAAKRAENQGIDQRALDVGYQRQVNAFDTAYQRNSEDFQTGTARLGQDRTSQLGQANSLYDRGVADRGTTLSRAREEDLFYGLDVDALKRYQAKQAGWGT